MVLEVSTQDGLVFLRGVLVERSLLISTVLLVVLLVGIGEISLGHLHTETVHLSVGVKAY